MMIKKSASAEHWATEVFTDVLSGGYADMIKALWQLFIKLNASTVLVFLHYRTGTRFINGATIFWGYFLIVLFMMLAGLRGDAANVFLFWKFALLFTAFGLYRSYEARKNLRRNDGKGEPRYGGDPGLSYLWPPFKRLLETTPLIPQDGVVRVWYQFDEFKFQRMVEPFLLFLLSVVLDAVGYGAVSYYIFWGAMSVFLLLQNMEERYYEQKQEIWDAQILSLTIDESKEPPKRERGMVIQQSIMRSDAGFETWKKEQQEREAEQEELTLLNRQVA